MSYGHPKTTETDNIKTLTVDPILLPTKDKANCNHSIAKDKDGRLWLTNSNASRYNVNEEKISEVQHLYLVNEDTIKEGDWVFNFFNNIVYKVIPPSNREAAKYENAIIIEDIESFPKQYIRIVATTDVRLNLALIPQSFIELYVKGQGKVDSVEIEMEENCPFDFGSRCTQGRCGCSLIPKLDKDGCVIIQNGPQSLSERIVSFVKYRGYKMSAFNNPMETSSEQLLFDIQRDLFKAGYNTRLLEESETSWSREEVERFVDFCLTHEIATGHDKIRRWFRPAGDATYAKTTKELIDDWSKKDSL